MARVVAKLVLETRSAAANGNAGGTHALRSIQICGTGRAGIVVEVKPHSALGGGVFVGTRECILVTGTGSAVAHVLNFPRGTRNALGRAAPARRVDVLSVQTARAKEPRGHRVAARGARRAVVRGALAARSLERSVSARRAIGHAVVRSRV